MTSYNYNLRKRYSELLKNDQKKTSFFNKEKKVKSDNFTFDN